MKAQKCLLVNSILVWIGFRMGFGGQIGARQNLMIGVWQILVS